MQQEYKWKFVETSQGYLYFDLGECFSEAVFKSRNKPNHLIRIEIFRPESEQDVIGFLKDGKFFTADQMSEIIEKER